MDKQERKYLIILAFISMVAFFSNLWVRPADLMEARNFITAREMIQNDNYIIPTLNDFLRFEKPPLPTWVTALVMNITENVKDEYILRIPVALCGILFIYLLYYFVKITTENKLQSFITAFIGSTTFMIIKIGNENTWDLYTYVFAFGAILFFIRGLKKEKLIDFFITGIFLSASIMSKGPIGIYGLILPFLIAHIYIYGFSNYKKNIVKIFVTLIITIIFSSIWPLIIYLKYPDYFLSILNKEKNTWSNSHVKSFVYYMDYFIYMGIWMFFSVLTLYFNWIKRRSENKNFSKFIFLWNILIILALSIIKMKKKRYGIPIYMISIIGVGTICYYYYNKCWDKLKKSDKILLYFQLGFISFISITIPIIIFFKGYLLNQVGLTYFIITIISFIPFIIYGIRYILYKKDINTKFIVIGSGILILIVNLTSNWFFDTNFINKNKKENIENYTKIKVMRANPPSLNIYSNNFEIEDVWRVGKSIKPFNINNDLPDKFIFLGEVSEKMKSKFYIQKQEIYVKENGDLAKFYYLKKMEG